MIYILENPTTIPTFIEDWPVYMFELQKNNIDFEYINLNFLFWEWVFKGEMIEVLREKNILHNNLLDAAHVKKTVGKAADFLRTSFKLPDKIDEYTESVNIIHQYFKELSRFLPDTNFTYSGYSSTKISYNSSSELLEHIEHDSNLYKLFYEAIQDELKLDFSDSDIVLLKDLKYKNHLLSILSICKNIKSRSNPYIGLINPNWENYNGTFLKEIDESLFTLIDSINIYRDKTTQYVLKVCENPHEIHGLWDTDESFQFDYNNYSPDTPKYKKYLELYSTTYYSPDKYLKADFETNACYWNHCAFCINSHQFKDQQSNTTELEKRIDFFRRKFVFLKEKLKIDQYWFLDSALSPILLQQFSDMILNNKLDVRYSGRLRIETAYLDKDFASRLKRSGFFLALFGIETFTPEVLKKIEKRSPGVTEDVALNVIKNFADNDIDLHISLILNLPGETQASIEENINKLKSMILKIPAFFSFDINILGLSRGSKFAKNPEEYYVELLEKELPQNADIYDSFPYQLTNFSSEEREKILTKAYNARDEFYKFVFGRLSEIGYDYASIQFFDFLFTNCSHGLYFQKFFDRNPFTKEKIQHKIHFSYNSKNDIKVIGGTGFLGDWVVQQLVENNHPTTCYVRDSKKAATQWKDFSDKITIKRKQINTISKADIKKNDIVIFIASPRSRKYETSAEFIQDFKIFLDSCENCKIIYISSYVLLPADIEESINEKSFLSSNSYYCYEKSCIEQLLSIWGSFKPSNQYTVIRVPFIIGPGRIAPLKKGIDQLKNSDYISEILYAVLNDHQLSFNSDWPHNMMHGLFIDVRDLARLIVKNMNLPGKHSINLMNDTLNWPTVIKILSKKMQKEIKIIKKNKINSANKVIFLPRMMNGNNDFLARNLLDEYGFEYDIKQSLEDQCDFIKSKVLQ